MPYVNRGSGPRLHFILDDFTNPWRNAPFLVLQHGLLKSARFGYGWIPYLSRYFRVVRPDLRGHGLSAMGKDAELDEDALVRDVVDLLDHLKAERVHFCGESPGGIVGTFLAAKMPERIRSLSLVSAPVRLSDATKAAFALHYADWATAVRELGLHAWATQMNALRFSNSVNPDLVSWQAAEMGMHDLETMVTFIALASRVDTSDMLARILAPVLGLYPVENTISGAAADILRQHIRDIRIVKLPSRHHAAFNAMPATCSKHVLAFAASVDGEVIHEI